MREVASSGAVDEYAAAVRFAPALIRSAGVGQALASMRAGKRAEPTVADHVDRWLRQARTVPWGALAGSQLTALQRLRDASTGPATWTVAADEALAIAGWLKIVAEAQPRTARAHPEEAAR